MHIGAVIVVKDQQHLEGFVFVRTIGVCLHDSCQSSHFVCAALADIF